MCFILHHFALIVSTQATKALRAVGLRDDEYLLTNLRLRPNDHASTSLAPARASPGWAGVATGSWSDGEDLCEDLSPLASPPLVRHVVGHVRLPPVR